MPENKHIRTPEAAVKITVAEACEIISKETGQEITDQTHWIRASIELTRDCPPYAVVQLEAFRR